MIHQVLRLTRPFIVFDVETTGLKEDECRIVELGFQTFTSEGLTSEWRSLINPCVSIPEVVTKIHGITDADVTVKCWKCRRLEIEHPYCGAGVSLDEICEKWRAVPTFAQLAERLAKGFSDCDFGGKNVRYDLRVFHAEMRRHKVPWDYVGACVIDADRLEQLGEPRHLANLYKKHTGKTLEDAHQALNDVRATSELIAAQMRAYQVLSPDLRILHDMQWPGWIDADGKFRFDEKGVPRCRFGKHRDVAMSNIPPSYYRWLIDADFSVDVKRLATDALSGKFPIDNRLKLE